MIDVFDEVFSPSRVSLPEVQLEHFRGLLTGNSDADQLIELQRLLCGDARTQFQKILATSQFASQQLCEHPAWLIKLVQQHLHRAWSSEDYRQWFSCDLSVSEQQWDQHLRRQRNLAMSRIIWRDFNRLADTMATAGELTLMAEAAIQSCLNYYYDRYCRQLGVPTDDRGRAQPLLVIGMGKLGAWELNLSSDIDLIFAYPSSGATCSTPSVLSNQEFFSKLGQRLIKSLDQVTVDGFVFRVDMRLRPYGQSGALVSNFNALEDYYQNQGREWERFAMIKARVVASNASSQQEQQLNALLRNFTYRRYVDFSAIDALRNLKQLINREISKRRMGDNVKLGRGGIREIEFIVQAFQLIRGGKDIVLQDRRLLHILPILDSMHCLPSGMADKLAQAYCFLRDVEHAIQGYQDKQTQDLPSKEDQQRRIAIVMGFADWSSFYGRLQQHRDLVHQQFAAVIATADSEQDDASQNDLAEWRDYWLSLQSSQYGTEVHPKFDDPAKAQILLTDVLLKAPPVVAMALLSRQRFDDLMPRLLQRITLSDNSTEILQRLVPLLTSTARRSAYLLLLSENPNALNQLVLLTEASPWISAQLANHPALLDELLDPNSLYSVPGKAELAQELRQQVLRIEEDDLEAQMEALRYFRSAHSLRVAACEVTGRLPLMKVSDYLTELAEVILGYVLNLAWRQMTLKHGYPDGVETQEAQFLVVGYGKLGGIELGHGSDLDLVFIHGGDAAGNTSGTVESPRYLDNVTFFARLGQKIIHILNTRTPSGQLYDVDMRLRPSGNSGLLVTSFSAFEKYQQQTAWTWEHQALVRARAVCGCTRLAQEFNRLRLAILLRERDTLRLAKDVVEMRDKMRKQLGSSKKQSADGQFHLKQDAGGIVDIEFMVQYAVLAWSQAYPALTEYTDNIRILECLASTGHITAQEVSQLIEAYKAYRSLGHRLALQQQPGVVDADSVECERQLVTQIWRNLLNCE